MIIITRNDHDYGPFDETVVAQYVEEGRLLMHDKARDAETGQEGIVKDFLLRRGLRPRVRNNGTLSQQLSYVGKEFIYPKDDMKRHNLFEDKRMLVLAIVGLSLSFIMMMPIGGYLVFYVVSLYFATIWGMFFYYMFRTRQVQLKTTVSTFFLTQLGVFLIFSGLNTLNFFYVFTHAAFPLSIIGYILGVGVTEEFAKQVPLYILQHNLRADAAADNGVLRTGGRHSVRCLRGSTVPDDGQHPGRLYNGFRPEHSPSDLTAVPSRHLVRHWRLLHWHGWSLPTVQEVALHPCPGNPRDAPRTL